MIHVGEGGEGGAEGGAEGDAEGGAGGARLVVDLSDSSGAVRILDAESGGADGPRTSFEAEVGAGGREMPLACVLHMQHFTPRLVLELRDHTDGVAEPVPLGELAGLLSPRGD